MESKAKLLGHSIHQMLIVFPLGLLATAVIFDIVYLMTDDPLFAAVSFYMITAGLIGGVLAAAAGFIDFLAIPARTRAKRIGRIHGYGNLIVMLFFSLSWATRANVPGFLPFWFGLVFSFLGVGLALVTAWYGGELVNRLGVGVDPGAHLDAPSSLSNEPVAPAHRMPRSQVPVTGEETNIVDEP